MQDRQHFGIFRLHHRFWSNEEVTCPMRSSARTNVPEENTNEITDKSRWKILIGGAFIVAGMSLPRAASALSIQSKRQSHSAITKGENMSHHLDSPIARQDVRLDITDLYVFRGETGTAFVINVCHSIAKPPIPGYHPEGMYEFNCSPVQATTGRSVYGQWLHSQRMQADGARSTVSDFR
jgi:hypothetical protein